MEINCLNSNKLKKQSPEMEIPGFNRINEGKTFSKRSNLNRKTEYFDTY